MAIGRVKDSTLKVFGNDYPTHDGTCVRDYLHVMDLAGGHMLALDALDETNPELYERVFKSALEAGDGRYKAYNLGGGKGQSVLDIVEAMRKATGYDFKTEISGRRYEYDLSQCDLSTLDPRIDDLLFAELVMFPT